MKPVDIAVGKTYVNRGEGRTSRKVLRIAKDIKCRWLSNSPRPTDEMVVEFQDVRSGKIDTLYIRSFATWAGKIA